MELKAGIGEAMVALAAIKGVAHLLKIILGLVGSLDTLEKDVAGVVNEIKDAPFGLGMLQNAIAALRKLADDIEKALS